MCAEPLSPRPQHSAAARHGMPAVLPCCQGHATAFACPPKTATRTSALASCSPSSAATSPLPASASALSRKAPTPGTRNCPSHTPAEHRRAMGRQRQKARVSSTSRGCRQRIRRTRGDRNRAGTKSLPACGAERCTVHARARTGRVPNPVVHAPLRCALTSAARPQQSTAQQAQRAGGAATAAAPPAQRSTAQRSAAQRSAAQRSTAHLCQRGTRGLRGAAPAGAGSWESRVPLG